MQETLNKSAAIIAVLGVVLLFVSVEVGLGLLGLVIGFLAVGGLVWVYNWYKRR